MYRAVAGVVLGVALCAATELNRASLRELERSTDAKFEGLMQEDPLAILGQTRGVYLAGYGVVFTTEVELAASAAPNPFRQPFSKQDIARLKEKKKLRISYMKESMRGLLISFATTLDAVPLKENVALAVTIPYFRWEDTSGMPRQILMVAPRQSLLEAKTGKTNGLATLKVQEFY
jgi:hypothetical protein